MRSPSRRTRVVYTDIDGTMVGAGGSLFRSRTGEQTRTVVDALLRLHDAGIVIVPFSGRNEQQLTELTRLIDAAGYIAELGSIIVGRDDGRRVELWRESLPPHVSEEARDDLCAWLTHHRIPDMLAEAFPRRIEAHVPWASSRKVTALLRGFVDIGAANDALGRAGFGWLTLLDNGTIARRGTLDPDLPEIHAYHLAPKGVSKAAAIARDMADRGIVAADTAAIGDSEVDLACAPLVSRFYFVGSPLPDGTAATVTQTRSQGNLGFVEAVDSILDPTE